ncbi:MAG TPA: response regulator [bacterium]|nr:response regulator [bacterium]
MATILVVEDDKNQRVLYEDELKEEGYHVILAKDGREAVRKVRDNKIDLVVLDIRMPGADGVETLSNIIAVNKKVPVILNTAYTSYKDNFMTWAAEKYIVKSSDLSELKKSIKEILDRKKPGE